MRAFLKTLIVVLPFGTLLTVPLALSQTEMKGAWQALIFGVIGLLCVGVSVQAWLANPRRQPAKLMQLKLRLGTRRMRGYHVVKQAGPETYVYMEQHNDNSLLIIWCFNSRALEMMQLADIAQVQTLTRGFRLNLLTGEVGHHKGYVSISRSAHDNTFSIVPPDHTEVSWETLHFHQVSRHKQALNWALLMLRHAEPKGFRERFHK